MIVQFLLKFKISQRFLSEIKAEVICALSCIENHLSMSAGGRCVEVIKHMYPDSGIKYTTSKS